MKLQNKMECMSTETEIVDVGVDDEAVEVQQLHVVTVGRGPTKHEIERHVASGHAQHRTWCDACMRALGIAGRYEKRQLGREDDDPLVAMDCEYLKLDGADDDDDHQND